MIAHTSILHDVNILDNILDNNSVSQQPFLRTEDTPPMAEASYTTKRARSATLAGDDEIGSCNKTLTVSRKRRKPHSHSRMQTQTPSLASEQAAKVRSDLSPATEAAIQEMPNEIKRAITSLKSIRRCVKGLLEFKAILDYRQLEMYQMWEGLESGVSDAIIS